MASPEIEARIAQESAKIKVDSYQKTASLGGWSAGGRTLWAISTVGAITGAAIGLIAPFFPMVALGAAALPAAATIATSIAAFAATGLVMGLHGGLMLGRVSGAAASVAEESEKRAKEWTTRQIISQNPSAEILPDAPKETPAPKPFAARLRDKYYTYINPRIGLVMAGIGLLGGLILGAAFCATGGAAGVIMPALGALTNAGLGTAAVTAGQAITGAAAAAIMTYSAGVGAAFGAIWSFNFPKITSEVTEFYGKLINGKIIGREWKPPEEAPAQATQVALDIEQSAPRSFADFRSLVAQQQAQRANDLPARN